MRYCKSARRAARGRVRWRPGSVAVLLAVAFALGAALAPAGADTVLLKGGREIKCEADVGSDVVRLDLGRKGILTLPGSRVKRVIDTEKEKIVYARGQVRGIAAADVERVGGTRLSRAGGVRSTGRAERTQRQTRVRSTRTRRPQPIGGPSGARPRGRRLQAGQGRPMREIQRPGPPRPRGEGGRPGTPRPQGPPRREEQPE